MLLKNLVKNIPKDYSYNICKKLTLIFLLVIIILIITFEFKPQL